MERLRDVYYLGAHNITFSEWLLYMFAEHYSEIVEIWCDVMEGK